jgi:4-amino-4-deoxy-L-arabinose transferase-like glycosyltransferase
MDKYKRIFIIFFISISIFRMIYVNFVPLVPQEAYYWKYAKNLALSYFDHPPMAAWIIAFFTAIGGDYVFFIRLGSVLFSLGLMVLLYKISIELFQDTKIALFSIVAISCTVLFSIGGTVITPDVPFVFFWALIIYSIVKLKNEANCKWWYLAGAALGFGLLSKYTTVLIVPGIFFYVLFSKNERLWLKTIHPYAALVLAFLIFTPVIVWNYQHDWASFLFQSSRRLSEMKRFRLDYFGQLIGTQLTMLTPYLFFLLVGGWIFAGRKGLKEKDEKYLLLFWLSLPVYLMFTVSSFRSLVKPNWMAPAYITSILAASPWIFYEKTKPALFFKKYIKLGLILGLLIVLLMHLLPLFPIVPIRKGDTWTGWEELAKRVTEIKNEMGQDTFIFGHEYKIPSEITYYTPNHEQTHAGEIIGENGLQYTFWTNLNELINRDAIFVTSNAHRYRKMKKLQAHFDKIEEDSPLIISFRDKVFREFYIYRCYNYKGVNQ